MLNLALLCVRRSPRARGMSTLELGISVIVLGVTFAMALQGSALVDTMRGFVTRYKLEQIQSFIRAYQERYGSLPGDDPRAAARWELPNAVIRVGDALASGRGDGRIQGALFDSLNSNGEQFMAWSHLRAAKMLDGDAELMGISAMPENAFGGVIGIDGGNLGQKFGSLCATRVPGGPALFIDKAMDDGLVNTGQVVATSRYSIDEYNHFDEPDSEPYNLEKEYIICVPILP